MAETDAENWQLAGELLDYFQGNACVVWRSRAGRGHYSIRLQRFDLFERYFIIPTNFDLLTQFAEVLNEVVSERIVVVDNKQHRLVSAPRDGRVLDAHRHDWLFAFRFGTIDCVGDL